MIRVDATFKESRNKVVSSKTEGNAEKAVGLGMYMTASKIIKEIEKFKVNIKSKTNSGTGIRNMTRTIMIRDGVNKC